MFEEYCNGCGKCCYPPRIGIPVSWDDTERWKNEKRSDITKNVSVASQDMYSNNQLIVPKGGFYIGVEGDSPCPFLEEDNDFSCSIHDTLPEICRAYPLTPTGRQISNMPESCTIPIDVIKEKASLLRMRYKRVL